MMVKTNFIDGVGVYRDTGVVRMIRFSRAKLTKSHYYFPTGLSRRRLYLCLHALADLGKCYFVESTDNYRMLVEFPPVAGL